MLKTHYRQPIDWTLRGLEEASRTLDRWYAVVGDAKAHPEIPEGVIDPLVDDLNTASTLAELHKIDDPARLKAGANLLGLLEQTGSERERGAVQASGIDVAAIETLIAARRAARAEKNWAESDRARDALLAMGVAVKDNKDGTTTWTVAP
ncbi:MAG TPA: cysteine--tRNA ligase, partial [Methylobacterium sp.]